MANSAGGGSVGSGAIRAGAAFVELFANDSKLQRTLGLAEKRVQAFGKSMASNGALSGGLGAGLLGGLGLAAGKAIATGAEFKKLADVYGDSVENISALAYAADASGSSFEQLKSAMENLPERISDAAKGGGSAAEMFDAMGVSAAAIVGLPFSAQLKAIADGMKATGLATNRAAAASKIFSDAGLEGMLPLLKDGAAGLEAYMQEAERVGGVMTREDAERSVAYARMLVQVNTALESVLLAVGQAVLSNVDAAKDYVEPLIAVIGGVRKWVNENRDLAGALLGVGAGLVAAGGGLLALGAAAPAVATGISLIGSAIGAVGFLLSPIGLVTAGLVALGAAGGYVGYQLLTTTQSGQEFAKLIGGQLVDSLGTLTTAWGGVRDAIASGDLALAGKIALAGLDVEWKRGLLILGDAWNGFKNFFADGFDSFAYLTRQTFDDLTTGIAVAFVDVAGTVKREFAGLFDLLIKANKIAPDLLGPLGNRLVGLAGDIGAADPAKVKAAIEADRQARENLRAAEFGAAGQARDAARAADLEAARAAVAEAERVLAELRALAVAPQRPLAEAMDRLPALQGNLASAGFVGTFATGGMGKQIFGTGESSIAAKQLEVQRGIGEMLDAQFDQNAGMLKLLEKMSDRRGVMAP